MSDKLRIDELKEVFKNRAFTSEELFKFYSKEEPDLKKSTFRWRVHRLKNDGIINSPKRGLYVTGSKRTFKPVIDKKLYSLHKKVKNQFPYSDMCIWETTWLNSHMIHQAITNNIIVEIDKEASTVAFAFLKESMKNVYLNPGKYEIENYILSGQSNVIIKNLVIESPIEDLENIQIPRIEKIIVDLFADNELFITYQGRELRNIYKEFFQKYSINQSTLNRYANRRNIRDRLITFLKEETEIENEKIYL